MRDPDFGVEAISISVMTKLSFLYILTNKSNRVLYTGVTSDLIKRVHQHKNGLGGIFTSKYKVNKLVYYQVFESIIEAITEEKRIKGGSRQQKIDLIKGLNPEWRDLYDDL